MDNKYGKLLNTCLCFRDKQDIARDYVNLIIGIDKIKKELEEEWYGKSINNSGNHSVCDIYYL